MLPICIDTSIRTACPAAALGCLTARVYTRPSESGLLALLEQEERRLSVRTVAKIGENAAVSATRNAYRAFGKDPHRYRNSAEAMMRRLAQGKGLYTINNVVEINNLLSLQSGYSMGTYDREHLCGTLSWRVGREGETYPGIGKDAINLYGLPVLCDAQGPFGNPSSDGTRAMITQETKDLFFCIYAFDGTERLPALLAQASGLFSAHARAENIETWMVSA